MKKFTFLFLSLMTIVFANAQTNLVANPGFETWASSFPSPWYVVGSTPPTGYTATQNTTIFKEGTSSIKMNVPTSASGTISVSQVLAIVPSGSYTLTVNYYVESGDGTDARVWCNFKKGTAFFAEAELVATGLYSQLRGPGNANSSGSAYLPDVKGSWQTYTTTFTAPADADGFDFQFRTYKGAVVNWDEMSLVGPTASGINSPKTHSLNVWLNETKKVTFNAAYGEKVEVFNSVGQKVLSQTTTEGKNELTVNNKGITIVKVGNRVGKIIL